MTKCKNFVEERMKTIDEIISSNQKALQSETKSSAGDKHETGRAMLQLEMEKASLQLSSINQMKLILDKINFQLKSDVIKLGSLVITKQANYFLTISVGEIIIDTKKYYAISPSSPIGKLLLGKKADDTFVFNGKSIVINEVC